MIRHGTCYGPKHISGALHGAQSSSCKQHMTRTWALDSDHMGHASTFSPLLSAGHQEDGAPRPRDTVHRHLHSSPPVTNSFQIHLLHVFSNRCRWTLCSETNSKLPPQGNLYLACTLKSSGQIDHLFKETRNEWLQKRIFYCFKDCTAVKIVRNDSLAGWKIQINPTKWIKDPFPSIWSTTQSFPVISSTSFDSGSTPCQTGFMIPPVLPHIYDKKGPRLPTWQEVFDAQQCFFRPQNIWIGWTVIDIPSLARNTAETSSTHRHGACKV